MSDVSEMLVKDLLCQKVSLLDAVESARCREVELLRAIGLLREVIGSFWTGADATWEAARDGQCLNEGFFKELFDDAAALMDRANRILGTAREDGEESFK